jgi:hypothetical protein
LVRAHILRHPHTSLLITHFRLDFHDHADTPTCGGDVAVAGACVAQPPPPAKPKPKLLVFYESHLDAISLDALFLERVDDGVFELVLGVHLEVFEDVFHRHELCHDGVHWARLAVAVPKVH